MGGRTVMCFCIYLFFDNLLYAYTVHKEKLEVVMEFVSFLFCFLSLPRKHTQDKETKRFGQYLSITGIFCCSLGHSQIFSYGELNF
jgi:hypothetical protein